jgi:hypothetical protein
MLRGRQLLPLLAIWAAALVAQGPAASVHAAEATVDIGKLADCGAAGVLEAGLTNCKIVDSTSYASTKHYTFKTDGKGRYGVLFILSTLQGDATMQFWGPGADITGSPQRKSIYVYTDARTVESYLYLEPDLVGTPGNFTLGIQTTVTAPAIQLHVYTPSATQKMVQSEADALAEIHNLCCSGRSPSSTITPTYQARDICKQK